MYDTHCYDLASIFLPEGIEPKIIGELADLIQVTIEDFIQHGDHAQTIAMLEAEGEEPC